jgi:pilus assembly protein CpaE
LVVDGGSRLTEPALTILERSHVIILLLAPELASLKSAVDTLRTLDQLNFDLRRVQPVMNWTFPSHGLAQKELEHVLGHQISAVIPYDSTACIQAINAGRPVVLAQPKTAISQAIQKLAAGVNDLSHDRQPSMTLVPSITTRF